METIRQLGNYHVVKTDAEFRCTFKARFRSLLPIILLAIVLTGLFAGLCAEAFYEPSRWLWYALLAAFVFFFVYGFWNMVIHAIFGKETLLLDANGFSHRRQLFWTCEETDISFDELKRVACHILKQDAGEFASGMIVIDSDADRSIEFAGNTSEKHLREIFHLLRETCGKIKPRLSRNGEVFSVLVSDTTREGRRQEELMTFEPVVYSLTDCKRPVATRWDAVFDPDCLLLLRRAKADTARLSGTGGLAILGLAVLSMPFLYIKATFSFEEYFSDDYMRTRFVRDLFFFGMFTAVVYWNLFSPLVSCVKSCFVRREWRFQRHRLRNRYVFLGLPVMRRHSLEAWRTVVIDVDRDRNGLPPSEGENALFEDRDFSLSLVEYTGKTIAKLTRLTKQEAFWLSGVILGNRHVFLR